VAVPDVTTIVNIIEILILLGGFWGVVHVLRTRLAALNGRVEALEGTVRAQEAALKTQSGILGNFESLIRAMQAIVDAADPKGMAERMKAYRELVERHGEEILERERAKLGAEQETVKREVRTWAVATIDVLSKLAPYVPPEERPEIIERLKVPQDFKEAFRQIAAEAPDLSRPTWLSAFAADTVTLTDVADVALKPPPSRPDSEAGGMAVR